MYTINGGFEASIILTHVYNISLPFWNHKSHESRGLKLRICHLVNQQTMHRAVRVNYTLGVEQNLTMLFKFYQLFCSTSILVKLMIIYYEVFGIFLCYRIIISHSISHRISLSLLPRVLISGNFSN